MTTHDAEKMLRAHMGTKPETPIDWVRWHWAVAPATGTPPCSSRASVAHTATRPSSQGPASALRFNYFTSFELLVSMHILLFFSKMLHHHALSLTHITRPFPAGGQA